jgi:lysophospholipase L1-like esterase
MRGSFGKIALVMAALLLCAVLGEVGVRWFHLDDQLSFDVDDQLYWRLRPNQTGFVWMGNQSFRSPESRINNLGTRGADIRPGVNGANRILMLGDSFTFGDGVRDDETFSAVVQRTLGDTVEVVNAGVPGYGIFQAQRLLQRLGPMLRPVVVVITVPTGDIFRQPFATPDQERAYLDAERRRKRIRDLSQFAALLYRTYDAARVRFDAEPVDLPSEQSTVADQFAGLWRADQQRLLAMAVLCRTWGGRLVVVAWPQHRQPECDDLLTSGIEQLAEQHGIIGLTGLDAVLSKFPYAELHIPADGHPAATAHIATGMYLAGSIEKILSAREEPQQHSIDRVH